MNTTVTSAIERLVSRYDPDTFQLGRERARIRIEGDGPALDVLLDQDGQARAVEADLSERADAVLSADQATWATVARKSGAGLEAFRSGRLRVRHDLHLGIGFLAATSSHRIPGLRLRHVDTEAGAISICEAGSGPPVLLLHGLGATKASFLPTVAALAQTHHPIAVDLPGFGDSTKPILAPYDPQYFARTMSDLLDALGIETADVAGNSMGGRIAIELGLRSPERVRRLVLLCPSLAWRRSRPWAPLLRLVPPKLGVIQPAPRPIIERIVGRVVPAAEETWVSTGVDEFLRSYLTPRGRAAFYSCARNIYLEEPFGENGFWTRLPELRPPSLFVWGIRDTLVPIGFAAHVRAALPGSEHLELDCGHVPQLLCPRELHAAMIDFLDRERSGS
jgi:pimeloyl-ACP methyl ester carboxylesterase